MTMPNAQCPQCSAMLPPGAVKCGYCGYTTPWGAVLQQQNERAASLQADQQKRMRVAKAVTGARNGMIMALVGLPICCGPLSLIGGFLGWRAGTAAKAEGQARPVTSVISLVVAIVSMCLFITGTIMFIQDQREKAAHIAAVGERLKGKRDADPLPQQVACDLIEEHLAVNGFSGTTLGLKEVHCDGKLAQDARRASQPEVRFAFDTKHFTANACLEKRARWFVLKVGENLSCADLPPPAPYTAPPRQLSDEEIAADEAKVRADLGQAIAATTVRAYTDRLAKVRADAASAPLVETTCDKATMSKYVTGDSRKKVATVDFDLLDASAGRTGAWAMLTSDSVRKILDDKAKMEDRASEIASLGSESGDLLVVYKAREKLWPVVRGTSTKGKDFSFDGGEYTGHLYVYDTRSGARLCGTKLAFESSEIVDFKKGRFSSEKTSAKEAVEADFKDRFEAVATDAIKRAAPDLRLGYRLLE